MDVFGMDGEPLTEDEQAALEQDVRVRLVGRDVVRARADDRAGEAAPRLIGRPVRKAGPAVAGMGRRLVVRTAFQVEPVAYSATVGGPWETLVAELRPHTTGDRHDGDEELIRLRWPDRDTAELAHAAVCRSLATTNLYQVVARLRGQVREHVTRVVGQAVRMDRAHRDGPAGG